MQVSNGTAPAPPPPPPTGGPPAPPSGKAPAATTPAKRERKAIRKREQKPLCPKLILHAVEGWGKTTAAAFAPSPLLLMAPQETGYDTLLSSGRVPQIPAEVVEDWEDALGWVDQLIEDPQGVEMLGIDAAGGFERLCHERVCVRDFGGDWGEKGFMGFMRGYEIAVAEWLRFLSKLEQLNERHGVTILMLAHTARPKTFKNPMGADYDRYPVNVHEKTWGSTAKWADAVFFGNFFTVVEDVNKASKKGKGVGGTDRVIYTERRDAFDAKNRFGCPEVIAVPDDPQQVWNTIWTAVTNPAAFG